MSRVVDSVDGCRQSGYVSVSRVSMVVDSCRHFVDSCRRFVDSLSIVVDSCRRLSTVVEGLVEGYVSVDNHRQTIDKPSTTIDIA